MSEDVQYKRGCAVQIKHIFSAREDVQYKQVDHHVFIHLALLKILVLSTE